MKLKLGLTWFYTFHFCGSANGGCFKCKSVSIGQACISKSEMPIKANILFFKILTSFFNGDTWWVLNGYMSGIKIFKKVKNASCFTLCNNLEPGHPRNNEPLASRIHYFEKAYYFENAPTLDRCPTLYMHSNFLCVD